MKKILYIFIFLFAITAVIATPVVSFATDEDVAETVVTEVSELQTPENQIIENESTIFNRIYEFFIDNKTDTISVVGSLGIIVFGIISKKGSTSNALSIKSMVSKVQGEAERNNDTQNAIVQGLNQMIDGYNNIKDLCTKMFERYEEMFNAVSDILKSNGDLVDNIKFFNSELATSLSAENRELKTLLEKEFTQNSSIIEILTSVCVNSKSLSQGVKDLVQIKHAQNLQLEDEAKTISEKSIVKPEETA